MSAQHTSFESQSYQIVLRSPKETKDVHTIQDYIVSWFASNENNQLLYLTYSLEYGMMRESNGHLFRTRLMLVDFTSTNGSDQKSVAESLGYWLSYKLGYTVYVSWKEKSTRWSMSDG